MLIKRAAAAALAVVAVTAALAAAAGPAGAHVTIPGTGVKGGFSIVTFSVPNERDDAGTVTLEVQLPADHPLAFVSVQPKPGWTVSTTTRTLDEPISAEGTDVTDVTDTVTWTGGPIEPGQFDTFSISVGPLPDDVDSLEFPAIQTYSSGEEVAWIEPTPENGEEPENPAPLLNLVEPAGGAQASTEATDSGGGEQATDPTTSEDDGGTDPLAVVALVVAVVAVILGGIALVNGRRRTT
jgi:uncharacterized protein YcnI